MKRFISAILICIMAVGLCACGDLSSIEIPPLPTVTPEAAEETAEPTVEPTEEPAVEVSAATAIVNIKHSAEQAYDPQDGSRLILTYTYDTPSVYIDGNEAASDKINETLAMLNESNYTGNDYGYGSIGVSYNDMLTLAEDNFNLIVENQIEGAVLELDADFSASVERNDSSVLTMLYNTYSFGGGAHGTYGVRGYSFDAATGEMLTLDSLSDDADALKSFLVSYMVNKAETDEDIGNRLDLIVEYATMEDVFEPLLRQGNWYLDNDGMVIFSDLYEISSYAAGLVYFNIPYSDLEGYIDASWIPSDIEGTGTITAIAENAMEEGSTTIIDKLTADDDGEQIYLVAEGTVRNVEISFGQFADSFYTIENYWYCGNMDNSALQLVATIPEGLPDLRVSYDDADGHHELYLTHSGDNGSVILSDSIEAVG